MNEVIDHLKPDCFYLPQHREIFSIMMSMSPLKMAQSTPFWLPMRCKAGTYDWQEEGNTCSAFNSVLQLQMLLNMQRLLKSNTISES
jgi:hypothetical protein